MRDISKLSFYISSVFLGLFLFTAQAYCQTSDLDKQIKEAQLQKAVYEAQKVAEEMRKAKADADKAATEAENAKAIQSAKQALDAQSAEADLQDKLVKLQTARAAATQSEIKSIVDAFKVPALDKVPAPAATAPKADAQSFKNSHLLLQEIGQQISRQVLDATFVKANQARPIDTKKTIVLIRNSTSNRALAGAYGSTLRSLRFHVENLGALTRRAEVSATVTPNMLPSITSLAAGVNLIGSSLQIAAALRPTIAYGSSTQVGQFTENAIYRDVATRIAEGGIVLVNLQESSPPAASWLSKGTATPDGIAEVILELQKLITKLDVLLPSRQSELADLQKAGAPSNPSRISVLQALIAESQESLKKAKELINAVLNTSADKPITPFMQFQAVETFLQKYSDAEVYWLEISDVTLVSDILGIQPALSRQRTMVTSVGGASWTIHDFSGRLVSAGNMNASRDWQRTDPH